MKKQLFRYKIKADQKVGRANKTEVLNDEVLQIEKHIEHIKTACASTNKKLQQCIVMNGGELEKRLKKIPEQALAQTMLDSSNQMQSDTDHNFSKTLKICADAQFGIAKEKALYEMFVEMHVSAPLTQLVDHEIPSILKVRERLKRLVLDHEHSLQTWSRAQKAQYTPGVNMQAAGQKADQAKEELDNARIRMEQCKDQLITEVFEFVTKEAKYTRHLADYVDKELDYHRRCVSHLEKLQPDLKETLETASIRSCYGVSLSDHLQATEREIASPIEACISCLVENGIYEEGIFRVAGGAAKLKKFRSLVDAGVIDLMEYDASDDIHAVAGALKQYLRELPDPLLTQALFDEWINISNFKDQDQKLQEIWKIIDVLPPENKNNLRYLMKFCAVLASHKDYNKMNASNIALVLAPNLLWPPSSDIQLNMQVSNQVSQIVENLITYVDWFFPEEGRRDQKSATDHHSEIQFSIPPEPNSPQDLNDNKHNRSMSGGAVSDASSSSNSLHPSNNGSPKHSRSSSTDFASVATTATIVSGVSTTGRKKRAPAPPPSSPAVTGDTNYKPPIASKRTSLKKPSFHPPEPPTSPPPNIPEEKTSTENPKPKVRAKPPPPSRKKPPAPHVEPKQHQEGNPTSPEMPDLPPPPLPNELTAFTNNAHKGDGLLSELSLAQSKFTNTDLSSEDENTPL